MEIFTQLMVVVLSVFSFFRPWFTIVAILVIGLFGSLVPELQNIRGLSIISIAGTIGILKYIARGELRGWPLFWPVSFFALFLVNLLVSGQMPLKFAYLLAGAFCSYYVTCYGIRTRRQAQIIAYTAILVGIIAAIVSFVDFREGLVRFSAIDPIYADRIHNMPRSIVGNPNYVFPFILPGLFFAFLLYFKQNSQKIRLMMFGAIGIMTLGAFVTLSRGTVVTIAVIFFILALSYTERSWRKKAITVLPLVAIIFALYYAVPSTFDLLMDRFIAIDQYSPGGRVSLAWMGISQFISSPFLGVGLGTSFAGVGTTQHDGYIALLGETGLLGFILFYSLPFALLVQVMLIRRRVRKKEATRRLPMWVYKVLQAFMIGILTYNIFNIIIYLKQVFILIAIIQLFIMADQGKKTCGTHAMLKLIE